ncbi:Bombesin receptor subtype-3 [Holothuria leucospilota]|uniref:Bombesin receptor subtype-3 n=1 Tax=Holothuria leucospilota TaxID=206669 RepID=A0A9Q1BKE9_HOLLE|nr:Bombesin receptor subtype-3 [Holothuria leucospilota]
MELNVSFYSYNDSCASYGETHSNRSILYILGLSLIFTVGLVANTWVIILITFVRELRNASNVFILVLCASNNVFLLIFIPFEIFQPDFHVNSLLLSRLIQYMLYLFCSVSIMSLLMMSFDRWRAVVRPMDIKSHNGKTTALKVAAVLILAAILVLPTAFVHEFFEDEVCNSTYIAMNLDILFGVTFYCMALLYICPLCLISFLYLSMAKKLLTQGKTIRESLRHHVKPRAQRSRVAWVVVGLVVSFAVCWFPYYLFLIIYVTDAEFYKRPIYFFLLNWRPLISLLNTCIDPLSIFLLGSRFRNHLWIILCSLPNLGKNRPSLREGAVTAKVRRTRSSSSSNSTTRTVLNLPLVSPLDGQC